MSKRKSATTEAPELAAPATPEVPAASTTVTHVIDLEPEDYVWATWRKREVLPRPEPAPFDFEACRKRLAKIKKSKYGWVSWDDANLAPILTRQEAHFWFLVMTDDLEKKTPAEIAEKIQEKTITGEIDVETAVKRIKNAKRFQPAMAIRAMFNFFDATDVVALMQHQAVIGAHWEAATIALQEFTRNVFPYMNATEVEKLKKQLRPLLDPKDWPTDYYQRPPMAFFLATLVGLPDELLAVVRTIPDSFYVQTGWDHSHYHQTQRIIFGLGSPQIVEAEMRRLKLSIREPEFLRAWLALTQFAALDFVCQNILAETRREACEGQIKEFARVKAPEAAPYMLELKLNAKGGGPARQWLDEQLANAITGLLGTAAGRGKLAEAAIDFLRDAKRKGHEPLIRAGVKDVSPDIAEAIRKNVLDVVEKVYPPLDEKTMPEDLKAVFATKGKGSLPPWAVADVLPKLLVNDHALTNEQTTLVLEALRRSKLDAPEALVTAIRKHADASSRDAFAWKIFQLWQGEGYPPKEKWAMGAVGHFGGDASALKITPLIRNWPGESQHQRAVFGLECLRTIGSDMALMQLNGISQKLKFKGLKQKATEAMEAIAKEKGLTRAELEDRVIPECDLDERGQRVFDFGTRQFRFVLGPDMKPMVKDGDGKVKTDLPTPGMKDDAAKATEAVAAWKLMKKQIKEVAKLQAARLEQAMVTGRRWSLADYNSLLVQHPLMIHLVRLLLWGGYDKSGKLATTFRVTEDQTLADAKDNAYTPNSLAAVGVVHPLHLSDEQKSAWGEVFSDYEIVPPFAQLGRNIFRLETNEEKETAITRFEGISLPAPSLVFGLENRGWTRGAGMDAGGFDEHSKPFPGSNVTAVVHYDGAVGYGYIDPNAMLNFKECYFVKGIRGASGYAYNEKAMTLSEVDPVAVSEVLADLSALAAKGT